jgi:hypothetical protein
VREYAELTEEADVDVSVLAGHLGHLAHEWNKVQKLRKKLDATALARRPSRRRLKNQPAKRDGSA